MKRSISKKNHQVRRDEKPGKFASVLNPKNVNTAEESELDMLDYQEGRVNAARFAQASKKMSDYLAVKYGRNAYIIENPEMEYRFPRPVLSSQDDEESDEEFASRKLMYNKELELYVKRKAEYEDNKPKVYAIIWRQCTNSMRHKVQESTDYNCFNETKDPRALWNTIKDICLSGRTIATNPAKRAQDAMDRFYRFRQFNGESIGDFYERFLGELDALEYAECDVGDDEKQAQAFLNKLDRRKYGKMMEDLNNSLTMGSDLYPRTVLDAYQMALNRQDNYVLNNHSLQQNNQESRGAVFHVNGKNNNNKRKRNDRRESEGSDQGQIKWIKSNIHEENKPQKSKKAPRCFFCNQPGHIKPNCPLLAKAAKELEKMASQKSENDKRDGVTACTQAMEVVEEDDYGVNFCTECTQVCESDTEIKTGTTLLSRIGEFDILCDNESSVNIFCESRLLTNIRKVNHTMHISGISGTLTTNMVGDFPFFGEVYYHPESKANVLCFYDLTKRCKVRYDSSANIFTVENKEGHSLKFKPKEKLYICDGRHLRQQKEITLIQTVEENELKYSKRDVERAEAARDLKNKLGNPSTKDLVSMIKSGGILNCPVTIHDVYRAIRIWGPDLASIKGKTTRRRPVPVTIDPVFRTISADVTLCVDIFKISGISFLLGVSKNFGLYMVRHLNNKKSETLQSAIDSFISQYKSRSFKITTVLMDGEGDCSDLANHLRAQGIIVNTTARNEHVPEIERAGRVLKERVRGYWNTLGFKLPSAVLISLVYHCVTTINMFPKASGLCGNLSPRELFTGMKVDFNRDCKIQFGQYVQVHEENMPTNSMDTRTTGAIALDSAGNAQGSYNFLSLDTWRVIKRRAWTVLPMPKEVIQLINAKAEEEYRLVKSVRMEEAIFRLGLRDIADEIDQHDEEIIDIPIELTREDYAQELQQPIVPNIIQTAVNEDTYTNLPEETAEQIHTATPTTTEPTTTEVTTDIQSTDQGFDYRDDTAVVTSAEENNQNIEEQDELNNVNISNNSNNANSNYEDDTTQLQNIINNSHGMILRNRNKLANWKTRFSAVTFTQMSFKTAINSEGTEAIQAAIIEMKQLLDKKVFHGISKRSLSFEQVGRILQCHIILKRKRNGKLKGRIVVDGRRQHRFKLNDYSSPTVSTEAIFLTAALEASEERHVITIDVDGAYLHAPMDHEVLVSINPVLSALLVNLDNSYKQFTNDDGSVIVKLDKALYGCIESALLFYKHISGTLLSLGFIKNAYDMCVFNKTVNGKQCTVTIHVDDLKVSCVDKAVLDDLVKDLIKVYKKVNVHDGKVLDYLGMDFDYSERGTVKVSMTTMIEDMLNEHGVTGIASTPAAVYLFKVGDKENFLEEKEKEIYHSLVAKLLYIAKRARPDILTAIAFLSTRIKQPTVEDNKKLMRVLEYLNGTKDLCLYLSSKRNCTSGTGCEPTTLSIHAFIDSSFAVHLDGKSHTGAMISLGAGSIYAKSSKQKLVTKSSTEAELVGLSDALSQVVWSRNFLKEQGYEVSPATIYQDNKSTITLAERGRSTSARTRHVGIRYFLVKDYLDRGEVKIEYKKTSDMAGDFYTKALQGELFRKHRAMIMNLPDEITRKFEISRNEES